MKKQFLLGVNYWPRHHGVSMWQEWSATEIDKEFGEIEKLGMNVVRVFLSWNDFQPIKEISNSANTREIVSRHDETESFLVNPSMVDPEMDARFGELLSITRVHNLKIIVALMTGYMSGVLLDVDWRKNRSIWTDPFMLKWQLLYCKHFARKYRNEPAILAWEFGNEHNCFMKCESPDAAWTWLRSISNQLKTEDPDRPVFSGMHGLLAYADNLNPWGIRESADSCDILTVHPYPTFTPGCFMDAPTDMRANLHASAENRYYECLGKKPVLCEETGSLGTTVMPEDIAAEFIRMRLYSLFANGSMGCLWWCFSDFTGHDKIPYKWIQMENDGLGFTAEDGRIKPAADEFRAFSGVAGKIGVLPAPERNAAIVLMEPGNFRTWETYYNTFVLCKQAGIEADFIYPWESFDRYRLLICPSVSGHGPFTSTEWKRMKRFVNDGGTLYLSYKDASLKGLEEFFCVRNHGLVPYPDFVENRFLPTKDFSEVLSEITFSSKTTPEFYLNIETAGAKTLMTKENGSPLLTQAVYGKGNTFLFGYPAELSLAGSTYALDQSSMHRVYSFLKEVSGIIQPLDLSSPETERTYHAKSPSSGYWVVVNYGKTDLDTCVKTAVSPEQLKPVAGCHGSCRRKTDGTWNMHVPARSGSIFTVDWKMSVFR